MPWLPFVRLCLVPGFFITQRKQNENAEAKASRERPRIRKISMLCALRKRNSKTPLYQTSRKKYINQFHTTQNLINTEFCHERYFITLA